VEAPGVECRRRDVGLATSRYVSDAINEDRTSVPRAPKTPNDVSMCLAQVDCRTVVRALENALVALDEDRLSMARKRIRLAIRIIMDADRK
jgi:hypothetical protein